MIFGPLIGPNHAEHWPGVNDVTKYVLSNTLNNSDWENTVFLKSVDDIKKQKARLRPVDLLWPTTGWQEQ